MLLMHRLRRVPGWRALPHAEIEGELRASKNELRGFRSLSVVRVEIPLDGVEVAASGGLGDCIAVNSETCVIVDERYQCVAMNSHIAHGISVRGHRGCVVNRPVDRRIAMITSWNTEKIVGTIFSGHALPARWVTELDVVG